jgi:hypothetical protein
MPELKVYEFSKHICALCAPRGTDVFRLDAKLGIDPMELLQMINSKVAPTKAVISRLAKRNSTAMCPSSRSWPLKSNRDTEQNTGRGFTVRGFTLEVARNRMGHHPRLIGSPGLDQSLSTGKAQGAWHHRDTLGSCGKPTSVRPAA